MKKSTKTVQISIMSMAVALTLGTGAVCLRPTSANASNAYLQTAITYQGEDNWYNYKKSNVNEMNKNRIFLPKKNVFMT